MAFLSFVDGKVVVAATMALVYPVVNGPEENRISLGIGFSITQIDTYRFSSLKRSLPCLLWFVCHICSLIQASISCIIRSRINAETQGYISETAPPRT